MNPFQCKIIKNSETITEDLGITDARVQELEDHISSTYERVATADSPFAEDMSLVTSICRNINETVYVVYAFTSLINELDNLHQIRLS